MLLRRMTEHVREQNWFAVLLDFLIVVFGVFIGFQLNNWNEVRKTDHSYAQARERVAAESQANIETVHLAIAENKESLAVVRNAIDVLRTCSSEPGDEGIVIAGLNKIRGTQTLRLRHNALATITQNEPLLSRQTESERERLSELRRSMVQAQDTLDWLETWPFETPIENHPAIGYGAIETVTSRQVIDMRMLNLTIPLGEACEDPALVKHFYLWERVATFQIYRAGQIEHRLTEHLKAMERAG